MQNGDEKKLLKTELMRLLGTLRPFTELPESTVRSYLDALSDISGPEIAMMVSIALRKNWEYLPNPGELREIVMNFRAAQPPEPPRACELCGGTRFRRVRIEENYSAAVPCKCMSPEARDRHDDWMKRFNPEFVSKA